MRLLILIVHTLTVQNYATKETHIRTPMNSMRPADQGMNKFTYKKINHATYSLGIKSVTTSHQTEANLKITDRFIHTSFNYFKGRNFREKKLSRFRGF